MVTLLIWIADFEKAKIIYSSFKVFQSFQRWPGEDRIQA